MTTPPRPIVDSTRMLTCRLCFHPCARCQENNRTALHVLCSWNRWEAVDGYTPSLSDEDRLVAIAQAMLDSKEWDAVINLHTEYGSTPLMEACQAAFSPRLVRLLLEAGAKAGHVPIPTSQRSQALLVRCMPHGLHLFRRILFASCLLVAACGVRCARACCCLTSYGRRALAAHHHCSRRASGAFSTSAHSTSLLCGLVASRSQSFQTVPTRALASMRSVRFRCSACSLWCQEAFGLIFVVEVVVSLLWLFVP